MMGLFKGLTKEIQNKPWIPFVKKESEPVDKSPGQGSVEKEAKGFCDPDSEKMCLTVCTPKPGCQCDAGAVRQALVDEIERRQLGIAVGNAKTGCSGNCKKGPFIGFPQKGFFYINVTPDNVPQIVEQTLINGFVLFHHLSLNPDRTYRTDIYYDKGSGLLAAMDDKVCMVEVAKYFMDFEEGLSCGKCVPCRIGLKRIQENMERIVSGQATAKDLEQIKDLCQTMIQAPHCEFAMASTRPILSAINFFEDEFKAHIERQECPAGVCKPLVEIQRKKAIRQRLRAKK